MQKVERKNHVTLTPVEPGTIFILFCMTCGANFAHFKKNPEADVYALTAADISVAGHIGAYSKKHSVELLDVRLRDSTPYPFRPQLIQ